MTSPGTYKHRQKLVGVCTGVFVASALTASVVLPLESWIGIAAAELTQHGVLGAVLFTLLFVLATVALVPASPLSLVAGLLYGPWAFALVWFSSMVAAAVCFAIARHLLAGSVEAAVRHRRRMRVVSEIVNEEGWRIVLLVRASGILPFGIQNYTFGATQIGFLPYLLATSVGIVPGILLYAGLGASGQAILNGGAMDLLRTGVSGVAIVAAIALATIAGGKMRARLAANVPND